MKTPNLLGDLMDVIERIRQHIGMHGDSIAEYETRTRQVLIDPLLNVLGWNVTNPTQVTLEYDSGGGKADYALLGENRPLAVIEAKRLQAQLNDDHIRQVLNYANANGIKYMLISNGDEWRMYDVFKQSPLADRMLMQLHLSKNKPHVTALSALRLWNVNVSGESDIAEVAEPILTGQEDVHKEKATLPDKNIDARIDSDGGWISFDAEEMLAAWQEHGTGSPMTVKIAGQQKESTKLASVMAFAIETLLISTNKLTRDHRPIFLVGKTTRRYFINSKPIQPNGTQFASGKRLSNGLYLFSGLSAPDMIKNLRELLKQFNVPRDTVLVKFNA